MNLSLISEIWNLVTESIPDEEREDIAYNLIGLLVEHGWELDDLAYEFDSDEQLLSAIRYHRDDEEEEEEEAEYEKYDDESDDDY